LIGVEVHVLQEVVESLLLDIGLHTIVIGAFKECVFTNFEV
jgi:hypothetical protein